MRILQFRTKIALLRYYRTPFGKQLLSYLKQRQIFQNATFLAKLKIFKFGTKTALFKCFGQQY